MMKVKNSSTVAINANSEAKDMVVISTKLIYFCSAFSALDGHSCDSNLMPFLDSYKTRFGNSLIESCGTLYVSVMVTGNINVVVSKRSVFCMSGYLL